MGNGKSSEVAVTQSSDKSKNQQIDNANKRLKQGIEKVPISQSGYFLFKNLEAREKSCQGRESDA